MQANRPSKWFTVTLAALWLLSGCVIPGLPGTAPQRQAPGTPPVVSQEGLVQAGLQAAQGADPAVVVEAARMAAKGKPETGEPAKIDEQSGPRDAAEAGKKLGLDITPEQAIFKHAADPSKAPPEPPKPHIPLAGRVSLLQDARSQGYQVAATVGTALRGSTVALLDGAGNVIVSGLTDESGNFSLDLNFTPRDNQAYILETYNGSGNDGPGYAMVRLRTIVVRSGSVWKSITSATGATPPVINALTTAVSLISALDATNVPMTATLGKVDASSDPSLLMESPTLTAHPDAEIRAMASHVLAQLGSNLDPVASISKIKPSVTAVNNVAVSSVVTPSAGSGTLMLIQGDGFSPFPWINGVYFQGMRAPVYISTPTYMIVMVPNPPAKWGGSVSTLQVYKWPGDGTTLAANEVPFQFLSTSVTINPNGFKGYYYLPGVFLQWMEGPQVVRLSPGASYYMHLWDSDGFDFKVNTDGTVSCPSQVATGGSGTLTFNTYDVTITPGQSEFAWHISSVTSWIYGPQTVKLVANARWNIWMNGLYGPGTYWWTPIKFYLNTSGTVVPMDEKTTGGAGSVTVNTVDVAIDPNGFSSWWIMYGMATWRKQPETLKLVKGGLYWFCVYGGWDDAFQFRVGTDGTLTLRDSSRANLDNAPSPRKLQLRTVKVDVNTNKYYGWWWMYAIWSGYSNASFNLTTNQEYWMYVWPVGWFQFEINDAGVVSIIKTYGNGLDGVFSSVSGAQNALNFNVERIKVNPSGLRTYVYSPYLTWQGWSPLWDKYGENVEWVALRGTTYYIYTYPWWDYLYFDVAANGNVTVQTRSNGAAIGGNDVGGVAPLTYQVQDVAHDSGSPDIWWYNYQDPTQGWVNGAKTLKVIKGQRFGIYTFNADWSVDWGFVTPGGTVQIEPDATYCYMSGSTIRIGTLQTVTVNTNGYPGNYRVMYGGRYDSTSEGYAPWRTGNQTFNMIRSTKRQTWFYLQLSHNSPYMNAWVDTAGNIRVDPGDGYASCSGSTMTFNTKTYTISTSNGRPWYINSVNGSTGSGGNVTLVNGNPYWLLYYTDDTANYRYFATQPSGVPSNPSMTLKNGVVVTMN